MCWCLLGSLPDFDTVGEISMEVLLTFLMMLWGSIGESHPGLTVEQLVQAMQVPAEAIVEQPDGNISINPLYPINKQDPQPDAPKVKGLYVTAHSAGGSRLDTLLEMIDETDLNALVIDLKDDYGYITFDTGNPELAAMGTTKRIIRDMDALMERLEAHNVYPIARIVVFKDTVLAKQRPDLSFLNPDGTVWDNGKKPNPDSFVNPYMKEIWDYNIAVAKEAVKAGFKEIQFDYVRFPEGFEKRADILTYTRDERSRTDVVTEFVKYAREQLNPLGVRVSVDIFGYAASAPADGIGQDFADISMNVDVICPMIYPSHYSTGWFGQKVPDAAPYATINGAARDTLKVLEPLGNLKPIIRPWIQDFTASWVDGYIVYTKHEVEEQIRALKENGIDEYLLWNATNKYTRGVEYK